MERVTHARCFHHPAREAVARCPACGRFFCRECVTEHDGRVICSLCLARIRGGRATERFRLAPLGALFHICLAFAVLWLVFYTVGRGLLLLPASFHEGTLWRGAALELE